MKSYLKTTRNYTAKHALNTDPQKAGLDGALPAIAHGLRPPKAISNF